jgi:integrase/recombinase XerC
MALRSERAISRPGEDRTIQADVLKGLLIKKPSPPTDTAGDGSRPAWFEAFLADRGTRKPSAHTMKAYRQYFDAIATLIVGDEEPVAGMPLSAISTDQLRTGFAGYTENHEAASIRRCWSTWNVLCTYLFTADLIPANPMPQVGRPKSTQTHRKALQHNVVSELVAATENDDQQRRSDWSERDRAIILTALLAGLRSEELINSNIGDLRRTAEGAVIHVRGKGSKDRRIPIETALVDVIDQYLDSRQYRLPPNAAPPLGDWPPGHRKHRCSSTQGVSALRAGPCSTASCAPSRKPASTANEPTGRWCTGCVTRSPPSSPIPRLAYALMNLLGHQSMSTSQRYVTAAGAENRQAAAQNPLYAISNNYRADTDPAE